MIRSIPINTFWFHIPLSMLQAWFTYNCLIFYTNIGIALPTSEHCWEQKCWEGCHTFCLAPHSVSLLMCVCAYVHFNKPLQGLHGEITWKNNFRLFTTTYFRDLPKNVFWNVSSPGTPGLSCEQSQFLKGPYLSDFQKETPCWALFLG